MKPIRLRLVDLLRLQEEGRVVVGWRNGERGSYLKVGDELRPIRLLFSQVSADHKPAPAAIKA